MLIDNNWVNSNNTFDVINPYTTEIIDSVPIASEVNISNALKFSYNFNCRLSGTDRAAILKRTAEAIERHKYDMAILITRESGLCIKNALYEVERAINCVNLSAIQAELIDKIDLTPEFVTHYDPSVPKLTVISEPWDLAVGITPFNHPLNLVVHKVAPAIAAGTAIVLKPSEKTPLTALKLGEILVENGLPANMLNIVTGIPPKNIVDQLITFPKIDLVSFTGGVDTGKYIIKKMVNHGNELKKFIPELGGNSAFVIMDDADIDLAAKTALSAFENSGQRCTSIKKILLHDDIAYDFIERFLKLTEEIKCGDPMDPEIDMGSVISEDAAILIHTRVNRSIEEGGKLIIGNERQGALFSPTIIDRVDPSDELVVKETFGPVAPIIRIKSIDDAIEIIKSGQFRLAGAIATRDREKALRLQNSICTGQFSWNGPPGYRTEEAPFGGFGDSGNGEKEGVIMTVRSMRRIRTFYEHRM
ncbi:MAG: aldehyde dehydrogenase family protein [Thermodesulfobacteriota bacterium]|nr:aldehyde dehydrogenase family protein [Thermodesulfobacteriota bacterium]